MTDNKQKNKTGRSFGINPDRISDGISGPPSCIMPGEVSEDTDDSNVNNHEPVVEIANTVHELVERNVSASDVANDGNVNNPEPDEDIIKMVSRLVERNTSGSDVTGEGKENIHEPEAEIANTDQELVERNASGSDSTRQMNIHKQNKKTRNTPRLVERATALRGLSISSAKDSKSIYRKQTERDLRVPYAEVPCIKTEHAIRDLVCSLMERQDRMNETIFLKLNDLEYRVDDLKLYKSSRMTKQPGKGKEVRK